MFGVCWEDYHPNAEETNVSNSTLVKDIRESLLASPYVDEIAQVRTVEIEGEVDVVGVRVTLTNLYDVTSVPPVIAELRKLIREVTPDAQAIFIEPDFTEPRRNEVPTESIVIRSWD